MKIFLILDALGLSVFVIVGTQKILAYGMSPSVAVIGGMITGICGGMLRDILCNDIPLVLRKELYAVIALAGGVLFITLTHFHVTEEINIFITLSAIFIARLLAILFHIEMPIFDYANSIRKYKHESLQNPKIKAKLIGSWLLALGSWLLASSR